MPPKKGQATLSFVVREPGVDHIWCEDFDHIWWEEVDRFRGAKGLTILCAKILTMIGARTGRPYCERVKKKSVICDEENLRLGSKSQHRSRCKNHFDPILVFLCVMRYHMSTRGPVRPSVSRAGPVEYTLSMRERIFCLNS